MKINTYFRILSLGFCVMTLLYSQDSFAVRKYILFGPQHDQQLDKLRHQKNGVKKEISKTKKKLKKAEEHGK